MSKPKQRFTLGGSATEVENAFYEALQTANLDKLMACWADEDDIVCVHPGGSRLVGAGAIRESFEAIFAQGAIPVVALGVKKVESMACAMHSVLERIQVALPEGLSEGYVIATNVYHQTPQGWRLVVHHASPGTLEESQILGATPAVLH
jgi:ketosteroid isomerase-like protein